MRKNTKANAIHFAILNTLGDPVFLALPFHQPQFLFRPAIFPKLLKVSALIMAQHDITYDSIQDYSNHGHAKDLEQEYRNLLKNRLLRVIFCIFIQGFFLFFVKFPQIFKSVAKLFVGLLEEHAIFNFFVVKKQHNLIKMQGY